MKSLMATFASLLLASSFVLADDVEPYASIRTVLATPFFVQDGYVIYD